MNDNDQGAPRGDLEETTSTGEYPVLLDAVADESPTAEIRMDGARVPDGPPAAEPPSGAGVVTAWLTHLESEIARLQQRWRDVEEQLNAKDTLVATLREEIMTRERAAAELTAELEQGRLGVAALESSLARQQAEVERLRRQVALHSAAVAEREARLAAAADEHDLAQCDLAAARVRVAELATALERERAATTLATSRNVELVAAQGTLTERIQELETYVDGRAQRWSALNDEIAEHKRTISRLEKNQKSHELTIEEADRRKRTLESALADLERKNVELTEQRKQREAAFERLERELAEQHAAAEGLEAALAESRAEHERFVQHAAEDRSRIATLEQTLSGRDAALAAREIEVRALEARLAEREAELAESRAIASREASEAVRLAAELEAKSASLELLERSVQRITSLGASVTALERRLGSGTSEGIGDYATTAAAPESPEHEPEELLPIESFMGAEIAAATDAHAAGHSSSGTRRLVGRVGGEAVIYPIAKSELTIGRGKASDIRIPSHYVSRAHAHLSTRGIATTIEDIGSKNGIFVNHERVQRRVLRDGDIVTFAKEIEFRFVDARH